MINANIKKKLLEDLDKLPVDSQKRVRDYAHALLIIQQKGSSGKDLLKFSKGISEKDADLMMKAINDECGQVDAGEW